jgi:hypothetical protein
MVSAYGQIERLASCLRSVSIILWFLCQVHVNLKGVPGSSPIRLMKVFIWLCNMVLRIYLTFQIIPQFSTGCFLIR